MKPNHYGKRCYACCSNRIAARTINPDSSRTLDLAICKDCGHATLQTPPSHSQNLEGQARYFSAAAHLQAPRSTRWPGRLALVKRRLARLGARGGSALDIGCNTGTWLLTLGSEWQKYGVEISPPAAAIARTVTGGEIFVGPLEEYTPPVAAFDLITAFALIEHLSDPRALIRWCYKHLKPGGRLALMTGDRSSIVAAAMDERWPLYRPHEHIHFFTCRSLEHLVQSEHLVVRHREWRYMYNASGAAPKHERLLAKLKELAGRIQKPEYDHLYLYAERPK